MRILPLIIRKLRNRYRAYIKATSSEYIEQLRLGGVKVGKGTVVFDTDKVEIDVGRPELLEIGNNVFIHRDCVILTHDWTGWCFVNSDKEFYPSHAKVKIGDNVWLGERVMVLKGVTIGNNCIIGAGAIVTKNIPDNSIAVGVPARVICSYDEYKKKRSEKHVEESLEYASCIIKSGRDPKKEDFYDDYPSFVDNTNYKEYNYPYNKVFNDSDFKEFLSKHKKKFESFEKFIEAARNMEDSKS